MNCQSQHFICHWNVNTQLTETSAKSVRRGHVHDVRKASADILRAPGEAVQLSNRGSAHLASVYPTVMRLCYTYKYSRPAASNSESVLADAVSREVCFACKGAFVGTINVERERVSCF